VLVYAFNWKKLSISAALGYRWDGQRCRLWFQTRPGSYNDERLIAFLRDLKTDLRGQAAILIWDGLPAHKSRKMQQYLESQRSWLHLQKSTLLHLELESAEPQMPKYFNSN
jgi:putative transposase